MAVGTVKMSVKIEARGVGGLVSDAKTYTDMMGAESRAACKHILILGKAASDQGRGLRF